MNIQKKLEYAKFKKKSFTESLIFMLPFRHNRLGLRLLLGWVFFSGARNWMLSRFWCNLHCVHVYYPSIQSVQSVRLPVCPCVDVVVVVGTIFNRN